MKSSIEGAASQRRYALGLLFVLACGGCASATTEPKARYIQAINHKIEGRAQAAYDELLALANESPDSRAGRRARAILTSGSLVVDVGMTAALAAAAWPSLSGFQAEARSNEAKTGLTSLADRLLAYQSEHGEFCRTFAECKWQPPARARYYYYLSIDEAVGGTGLADTELLRLKAEATLAGINLPPRVTRDAFFALAIGDPDEDGELDVWGVDQNKNLIHMFDD